MSYSKTILLACLLPTGLLLLGCSKTETIKSPTNETTSSEVAPNLESVNEKSATTPFNDVIAQIPGTIEAENYDQGEPGVAYVDQEVENLGADDHRSATQVDIEKRDDASGGYGVGWTRKGEWTVYTVSVQKSGTYKVEIPVASDKQGGTFHLEFDGEDVSGPIQVPDTGGWGTLQTITQGGLKLKQGVQTMKLIMDTAGPSGSIGDIDCLRFSVEEN